MTNQSLDIQPALRPFNVLVRGGRLTKFKGRVASIAPGLSVVATAAVLFTGGSATQAVAQGVCGVDGDQVSCEGVHDNGISFPRAGDFTVILDDITVGGSGVAVGGGAADDVTVQMGGGTITTQGTDNHAIRVDGGATEGKTAKVVVTGGEIEVDGQNAVGLYAVAGAGRGNAFAQLGCDSDDQVCDSEVTASVTTKGGGSHGIDALINDRGSTGTATALLKEGGEIETKLASSAGLVARTRGVGGEAFAHMSGGQIITNGEGSGGVAANAHGVVALVAENAANNSEAKATALMTGGTIETKRSNSAGVRAHTKLASFKGELEARMEGGSITTNGNQAHALQAFAAGGDADSTGKAIARMVDGIITVNNINAHGAYAFAAGGGGEALVEMSGGSITTNAAGSFGVFARTGGASNTNGVQVKMTGGSILTRNIDSNYWGSHGIFATTPGSGDVLVNVEDGTVTAMGRNSHAILAEVEASGGTLAEAEAEVNAKAIVHVGEDAVVTALGAASDGIRVLGLWVEPGNTSNRVLLGVKEFEVSVAGSVTGGAYGVHSPDIHGAAIRTISDAEGSGTIHIADTATVTAGSTGVAIVDWDGDAVVTVDGTVTGDILLGAGDDTLTISSDATYDFSHTLDGGAGDDRLTLHGQTVTSMENITNWEHLTLNETQVSLDGVAMLETGLSIDAGSEFHATGGNGSAVSDGVARASGGGMTITGDVINAGAVTLSVQDGVAGDEITIEGDYTQTGSGESVFALDTVLRGEGSNSDRVVIVGDTSGEMKLSLAGLDSIAPEGAPLELEVVSVGGTSDGTFTLMEGNHVTAEGEHGVIAGAHLYTLARTDGGWALSALTESGEVNYQPSAPVYDSYGPSLLALNAVSSLRNRGGSAQDFRRLAWSGQGAQTSGSPLWIQMGTEQIASSAEHSTTGAALDSSLWEMEIGADIVLSDSGAGLLVGGLMLSYATGSTDVSSDFGDGSIDTTGLGLGLAATWYDTRRFYVDGQLTWASYSSDLSADRFGALTEGNGGTGYALSIEAGQQLDLGSRLTVIPQAQLSLSTVAFSDFTGVEDYAERVAFEDASSQQLRLGLEFGAQDPGASGLYGIVNLFHEFGAGSEVDLSGASLTTESEPWAVGVGFGGRYAWSDRVDLFGEASYATGLSTIGDTSALSASAGLKVVF